MNDALDYWRLCEALSVEHAARLLAGEVPQSPAPSGPQQVRSLATTIPEDSPLYLAARSAITDALRTGSVIGEIFPEHAMGFTSTSRTAIPGTVDVERSRVRVDSLREWLRSKGVSTGFFFSTSADSSRPDYLDPQYPMYSPKLAAAVSAWEAVRSDATATRGRTPKKAVVIWLRKNAARYGLTNRDGNPNETGIEEVAKIANWKPMGGAPKTPTSA